MLQLRTEAILKSIVEQYIARATPVPSQSITNNYELAVSAATIRNEMAHLEQEGYITRYHPSAGSVPSDKGYRYYVESLDKVALPLAEQRLVIHLLHQVEQDIEEWLSLAATLMAQLAQNVAVATIPKPVKCKFKHLELVSLRDLLALVVLVFHGARVRQQLITFDQAISQAQLTVIANKLSTTYSDLTNQQILAKDTKLSPIEQQVTNYLLKMMQTEDEQQYEEPYVDGLHFILNQPEFARNQQGLNLMELVEHRNLLMTIVPHGLASQQVQVIIGNENKAAAIHNYSVVISQYGLPEEAVGTICIVGPTRMAYARTISILEYLSTVLSGMVAELYGRKSA